MIELERPYYSKRTSGKNQYPKLAHPITGKRMKELP